MKMTFLASGAFFAAACGDFAPCGACAEAPRVGLTTIVTTAVAATAARVVPRRRGLRVLLSTGLLPGARGGPRGPRGPRADGAGSGR
ncbi:hypothetical protein HC023_02670 [Streptomyces sp. NEAU-H3]|nr:hypothetical protein [Streptomyces sp. NEAU-H3]